MASFLMKAFSNIDMGEAMYFALVLTVVNVVGLAIVGYAIGYIFTSPEPETVGKVKSIIVYPLKSARGVQVKAHSLDARGLTFDRQWMVVDEHSNFLSQRRSPRLALVEVALPTSQDAPLKVSAPSMKGTADLEVPAVRVAKDGHTKRKVRVWDDRVDAIDQGDAAAAWFAAVLGVEGARLMRMADGATRPVSRKYAPRGTLTTLNDGFPLLLANESSLDELNDRLQKRGKQTIPMDRFRPNLVVGSGVGVTPEPFAEDGWAHIAVGSDAQFGVVKPCARCKMPTINQSTGVPDQQASNASVVSAEAKDMKDDDRDEGGGPAPEAEPTATLRTFRSGSKLGYAKPGWKSDVFFGQNILIHTPGVALKVGDTVVATPRRPRGWFSRGIRGVDYDAGKSD